MNRTSLVAMLVAVLALSQPAWAQGPGNGKGNSENASDQGNSNGQEQSENAGGEDSGHNGNGFGQGNGFQQGNAPQQGEGKAGASLLPNGELSENDALAAVEAGRAVELETLLPDVRSRTGGEVINAQLQQVGEFLIYAVTVLTPSGQVLTEHYYARSGAYVGK
jgi:hypothetical protein